MFANLGVFEISGCTTNNTMRFIENFVYWNKVHFGVCEIKLDTFNVDSVVLTNSYVIEVKLTVANIDLLTT